MCSNWLFYPLLHQPLVTFLAFLSNLHVVGGSDLVTMLVLIDVVKSLGHSIVIPAVDSAVLHKLDVGVVP